VNEPRGTVTEKAARLKRSHGKHDLTGRVFTRWTVIELSTRRDPDHRIFWRCRCECGVERDVDGSQLRCGRSLSCGCLATERRVAAVTVHGCARAGAQHRAYGSWQGMKQRCLNTSNTAYQHYGGRWISIDPRWIDSFETFLADMGPCPAGFTIERNDVNGNYEPSNCRWATQKEQTQNTRATRRMTLGDETLNLSQWAAKLGVSIGTLRKRRALGWSDTETLTRPIDRRFSSTKQHTDTQRGGDSR